MNEIDVVKCEVSTLNDVDLKEAYGIVPAVEKKCREIKSEVKKRIKEHGNLDHLKIYTSNAGIKITDIVGLYEDLQQYLAKDEFLACCTVTLTALKSILIPKMQAKYEALELKKSKVELNAEIDLLAEQHGERKTKEEIF